MRCGYIERSLRHIARGYDTDPLPRGPEAPESWEDARRFSLLAVFFRKLQPTKPSITLLVSIDVYRIRAEESAP